MVAVGKNNKDDLPDKLELIHHVDHIEIVQKWFRSQTVLLTAFTVFWHGLITVSCSKAFLSGEPMAKCYLLIVIGLGLTYFVVVWWVNCTHISVSQWKITVRHRPFPWLGDKELATSNLKQLYAKEKVTRTSRRSGRMVSYHVHALTRDGGDIRLVGFLQTKEQALYIEREIEKYLEMENLPVKGEIGG